MAEYLKLPEVARRLDVSEKTARRYVKSGTLPSVFIGGAYRVSEPDLEQFLESAKVEPGKAQAPPSSEPTFNDILTEEERRNDLREAEEMFLEAHGLLEELSETYRSTNDTKRLEALISVVALSGYGAIQHAEDETNIDSLRDEESLNMAMCAIKAAGRLSDLIETLVTVEPDELTSKRHERARKAARETERKLIEMREAAHG